MAGKIGRPRKGCELGERMALGLRVTAEAKAKLEKAADESGRSQSQEAEARLERTFRDDEVLAELRAIRCMLEGER